MSRLRGAAVGLAVAAILVALPAGAAGLVLVWDMEVTPTTVKAQQSTTFTFTATNNLDLLGIGCVEVDLPEDFDLESYSTPVASNGQPWEVYLWDDGEGNLTVVNHALSDFGLLGLTQSLTFSVSATPHEGGTAEWTNHVHRSTGCDDFNDYGPPLEVTVQPAPSPTPTPTPKPTATPTPKPTATPTPKPTPAPTERPTARPSATPRATSATSPSADASPTATPTPTASPTSSGTVRATASTSPAVSVGGEPPSTGGSSRSFRVPDVAFGWSGIGLGSLALVDTQGMWFVPAAVIGVPGLLVLLWVAAQAIGAAILVPAVRRWGEEEKGGPERTRPRQTRPRRG